MRRRKIGEYREKKHVFALDFSFSPCDNDSELSSSMNEDVPEVLEGEFIPYDENLEPVAIEKEAAALYNFCGS